MSKVFLTVIALSLSSSFVIWLGGSAGCGGGGESSDCQLAEETYGQETQALGEDCTAGTNSGCEETLFDNCIDGTCEYVDDSFTEICTESCTSDSDCPTSISTCGSRGYCTASGGGGGGGSSGSCSSCLDSCSGDTSCCCGSGCICEDSCTDACNDE